MIITEKLLNDLGACQSAKNYISQNCLYGQDETIVTAAIEESSHESALEWIQWWNQIQTSPIFIRAIGNNITMKQYFLFNPTTGQHTSYPDESSAKSAMIVLAKQVLKTYCPDVSVEIQNENGDSAWEPLHLIDKLNIS